MIRELDKKIILITGASSGFGLITAARLSQEGHKIIATMRDIKKQPALLSEVNKRGGTINVIKLDVTEKDSIVEAAFQVAAEYGYIDVLINNAGYGIAGAFEDLSEKEIRAQMETNFFGVQNVTREFIPLMRHRKGAKIINISSVSGFTCSPLFGAYCASKWALEAFSESLRYELSFFGIDVLLVEPGSYKTKIFYENSKYAKNFDNVQSPYYDFSQFLKKKIQESLTDNHKDPEDVAELIEDLINTKNPPFRNIPDVEAQIVYFLRRILPFRIFSWIYKKIAFKGFAQKQ